MISNGKNLHTCLPQLYASWSGSFTLPVPRWQLKYSSLAAPTNLFTFCTFTTAVRIWAMQMDVHNLGASLGNTSFFAMSKNVCYLRASFRYLLIQLLYITINYKLVTMPNCTPYKLLVSKVVRGYLITTIYIMPTYMYYKKGCLMCKRVKKLIYTKKWKGLYIRLKVLLWKTKHFCI